MTDHSEFADMLGFCACDKCVDARAEPRTQANLNEWHLWTIRSDDASALSSHRQSMIDMGFNTGPIEVSRGWAGDCLPYGWGYFSARIPKAALSVEDFESLCAWDRKHGEVSRNRFFQF